jgi:hypothetical protein
MKKTFQISVITVFVFFLLGSCTKDDDFEAIEMDLQCLSAQSPIIIQSQEEYDSAKTYDSFECDSSYYPVIDFSNYTLVGVVRYGCGWGPVTSGVKSRKGIVTVHFEEQEDSGCLAFIKYAAWCKIPKTDSDKIEFDIDEVR